ncbi:MAG: AraC family transcriptional regulator [Cyanobacteria bacterium P01_H01_bin.21]
MAITLSVNHPEDWMQYSSFDEVNLWHFDDTDKILKCPKAIGRGYGQHIVMRDGLSMVIVDYEFRDDFVRRFPSFTFPLELEVEFILKGPHAGQSVLKFFSGRETLNRDSRYPGNQRIFKIELHLQLPILRVFVDGLLEQLPAELQHSASNCLEKIYALQLPQTNPLADRVSSLTNWRTITPQMRYLLQQILNCPYQGLYRRVYLESKALELMMLRSQQMVEQILCFENKFASQDNLELDELRRTYEAKELLLRNLQNPPSTGDLAQKVNLNRRKLNENFQQVFHMTLFEYLQDYRLQQARSMLSYPDIKVEDVINAVGYKSRSGFAVAFRKKFGLNPKLYQQQCLQVLPEKV